jgi:outer membrane protein OmpA-like peptidoglycan-associated protein/tetratricopeptide (TPR) repeat protein
MKNIYLVLLLVLAGTTTIKAQSKDTERADKLFQQFEYIEASEEYLKLVGTGKKENYIYKQLAESYYNLFNTKEAIKWFALTVTQPQDAETYFKYAQMLKANGRYEEANAQMATFSSKAPNDQRAKAFKENPNYIPKLLSKQKSFTVSSLDINSDKSEFGAMLSNDNILYFSSARRKSRKTAGWNDEPFLDLYQSIYDQGKLSPPSEITELNTVWHDGPATVTTDGNTMYYSRDSHADKAFEKDKKINTKFSQVYLYKATRVNGKWENSVALPFNSMSYSVSNPSISKDGKTLYFNSNMPGGLGGNDIWRVAIKGNDTYGAPENLGARVNTEGNEQFPFITEDNVLYFCSSARPGLGGLDVFSLKLDQPEQEAQNVGKPVNSEKDDFSFSFNTSKNVGFFSSNRDKSDDIYIAFPVCAVESTIVVTNAVTKEVLEGATVVILDDKKNSIESKASNAMGQVAYLLECDKEYHLQVTKEGYESGVFAIDKNKGGKLNVPAPLNPIEVIIKPTEIVLNPIYFEFNKSNITQQGAFELDKLVQVMQSTPEMIILAKSHTDNRGSDSYNMNLSQRRAKATAQYVISKGIAAARITAKGFGETEPVADCKENCTEEQHAQNRRSEFLIVK